MKKTIRIMLPIILSLTIILCVVWYLFVYDREFTRDVLLTCARFSEEQGHHSTAALFYDLAYSHSGDNDSVAIELADQYKASNNYTKAEYTLANAISDGGGTELYIALCKTYVEQDKLLDAVNMLNNIANAEVKAEIDALRPAAPAVDLTPGFYSTYISVNLHTDSGTLYATTNGEYPSATDLPYSEPLSLVEGENTVLALSVSDNGLVSPLSTFGYTIGGIIEEVAFTDPAIETSVRSILGIEADDLLFTNDLWSITEFTVPTDASSYSDLKYLSFLETLTIENGKSDELYYIAALEHLSSLQISDTTVSDDNLIMISELPKLTELALRNCNISSIEPLTPAVNLISLDLSNNTIRNLKALSSMSSLQELILKHNAVTDPSALSTLSALTKLDVSYNSLTSLAPISGLSNLTWLDASSNLIASADKLEKLTGLMYLSLANNKIADISNLAVCTTLTELDVSNNQISDILSLASLNGLIYFNFSHNQVAALPEWSDECALVTIDGSNNLLENIDILGNMEALNNVFMDYNAELASVEALANCPVLIQVNVYGTKVTEVDSLTKQSVIVHYNPVQETE